ncbi:N-acetylglucosaminyldiphosphodolichol N-acetylglucosaminyltransferase [Theileria orientalis]|uniref:UDP-N-acetylglucosamine transferase subunit ALG14 n=1 Tax=Theileria orientalis TaxID=68886 RepID=A0A976SK56_THEOR|nr:N-acetylglucosaminyldiphosphodolichol N-acetylglucosaminyltransferase [Theileria orientalis]
MIGAVVAWLTTCFNTLLILLLYIRYKTNLSTRIVKTGKIKTTLVLGPGGHTREMIEIFRLLESEKHEFSFVHSEFDRISPMLFTHKVLNKHKQESKNGVQTHVDKDVGALFHTLPYASRRHLLYTATILTFVLSMIKSLIISYKLNPDLIITNGPGLSVPFCMSVKLLNVLLLRNAKIIYIESLTRVKTLS